MGKKRKNLVDQYARMIADCVNGMSEELDAMRGILLRLREGADEGDLIPLVKTM